MTDSLDELMMTEREEQIFNAGVIKGKAQLTSERLYNGAVLNSIHRHMVSLKKDFEKLEKVLGVVESKILIDNEGKE